MKVFSLDFCIVCFLKEAYFLGMCMIGLTLAPMIVWLASTEILEKYPFAGYYPISSRLGFFYIFYGLAFSNFKRVERCWKFQEDLTLLSETN